MEILDYELSVTMITFQIPCCHEELPPYIQFGSSNPTWKREWYFPSIQIIRHFTPSSSSEHYLPHHSIFLIAFFQTNSSIIIIKSKIIVLHVRQGGGHQLYPKHLQHTQLALRLQSVRQFMSAQNQLASIQRSPIRIDIARFLAR